MPAKDRARGPKPNSARQRLLDFFHENPDEELSTQDACVKLNLAFTTVKEALEDLHVTGELEHVKVWRVPSHRK